MFAVYLSVNPSHASTLLDFQQVMSYTHYSEAEGEELSHASGTEYVHIDILVERITREVVKGNISSVCKCSAWKDEQFVKQWVRFITCEPNTIPSSLLKILVEAVFCSKEQQNIRGYSVISSSGLETNLLASLIKTEMIVAVTILLGHKTLQGYLKQSNTWMQILQRALEIACEKNGNINLDVIQAILKSQCGEKRKQLYGSRALIQALIHSDVECARLLLQDTRISPTCVFDGGYFHCLVKSDVPFADFRMLCDALLEKGADINQKNKHLSSITPIFQCIMKAIDFDSEHILSTLDRLVCLVEMGADIHATIDPSEENIVAFAIGTLTSEQCLQVLSKLFELKANFEHVNNSNMNAIHALCKKAPANQTIEILSYLIAIVVDASHRTK